jgi:hypothetical protein
MSEDKDFQRGGDKVVTTDIETNWFESVDSFHKLGLKEELLRGIYGKYYYSFEDNLSSLCLKIRLINIYFSLSKVTVLKSLLPFNNAVSSLSLRVEILLHKLNLVLVRQLPSRSVPSKLSTHHPPTPKHLSSHPLENSHNRPSQ